MSLLNSIKQGIAKSGSSKGKILYTKDGSKVRVRFLQDIEEGIQVVMHNSFEQGINALCAEHYGGDCPYCGDDSIKARENYVWCVFDHDAKEVKLFMGAANQFSPLPALVGMFESYGTATDRDYVINQTGSGTSKTFSVVPMDKTKFRNAKAKPLSEKAMIKLLKEAFPIEGEEEEEEAPKKKKNPPKKTGPNKRRKPEPEPEEEDDEEFDEFEDDVDEDESEYEGMSAKELYKECKDRGLDVKPKKKPEYYIEILEEDDEENDDEEDDWEDEDDDEGGDW